MIEALLAFFLVTVVLSTAVAGRAGSLAPLAIGMTLTFNILMGGALTGAPFNPARALGPMVATGNFNDAMAVSDGPGRWRHRRSHSAHRPRPARPRANGNERPPRDHQHARRMSPIRDSCFKVRAKWRCCRSAAVGSRDAHSE